MPLFSLFPSLLEGYSTGGGEPNVTFSNPLRNFTPSFLLPPFFLGGEMGGGGSRNQSNWAPGSSSIWVLSLT